MTLRLKHLSGITASSAALLVLLGAACTKSSVAPTGSVTVTTPALLGPSNGAQISNLSQPVTLTVSNAFVTDSSAAVVYTFEVAVDSAFATKVQTKTASAGLGQTAVVLDALPPGQNYFWHARATGADTPGPFSPTERFTIGAALALSAPSAVSPLSGASPSGWPTFTVTNTVRTGPIATVTYRFDVSASSSFTSTVLSSTVAEGTGGQTSFTPSLSTSVPVGTPLFWRATALDAADGIVSAPSAAQSLTLQALTQQARLAALEGVTLWSGIQPPGTNGHANLGNNWSVATFVSFNGVTFLSPPLEILQEFDLIDRGMNPQDAITWMQTHGYFNDGVWVPAINVVGFPFEYISLNNDLGWDLVLRAGG
jgi:hypothetical protein